MHRFWLTAGALNMLLALIIAAATGHQPPTEFVPVIRNTFDTAREMHVVHALALIAIGTLNGQLGATRLINVAGWAFLSGIALFCGGIYVAFGADIDQLKVLIPFGGVAFMVGWMLLAAGAFLLKNRT